MYLWCVYNCYFCTSYSPSLHFIFCKICPLHYLLFSFFFVTLLHLFLQILTIFFFHIISCRIRHPDEHRRHLVRNRRNEPLLYFIFEFPRLSRFLLRHLQIFVLTQSHHIPPLPQHTYEPFNRRGGDIVTATISHLAQSTNPRFLFCRWIVSEHASMHLLF